ncbi:protein phosphatase 1 regulatory subunit 3B-like [Acropora muricata]|uniref:protein phosphatase 1 regulatory subunit 3B-like n=1 Tax=Acropora muricata TaxID=159855 RepID=UPI0034E5F086
MRKVHSVFPPFSDDDELDGNGDGNGSHSILRNHSRSLPPRKKSVQFADGCGKPLVSVYSDDEYNIHMALQITKRELQRAKKTLHLLFSQPVASDDFRARLEEQSVCLENAVASQNSVWGTIKVKNVCFHKKVLVRYSLDHWTSSIDLDGAYVPDSNDGATDRFSFALTLPEYFLATGGMLEFAVRFEAEETEFWDNNNGQNYRIECREAPPRRINRMASLFRDNHFTA